MRWDGRRPSRNIEPLRNRPTPERRRVLNAVPRVTPLHPAALPLALLVVAGAGSFAPQPVRASAQERLSVAFEASADDTRVLVVRVRNDFEFPVEAIRLAYSHDGTSNAEGAEITDYLHQVDRQDVEPGEGPIRPGETRVFLLDVGAPVRPSTRAWVSMAMFGNRTWAGDQEEAESLLRDRRNEAIDLEYWIDVLGSLLSEPEAQARRVLRDRIDYRRQGGPPQYPAARFHIRELQDLTRLDDDGFRSEVRALRAEYSRVKTLAERRFARARN